MGIKDLLSLKQAFGLPLLAVFSAGAIAQEQYFHCEYLDAVEANWGTGRIERNDSGSRQYIGKKFTINRQTGKITASDVSIVLFPPSQPEVAKSDLYRDNYQLVWREKYTSGYQQVTFLNVREGHGGAKGAYQFTHITTTDWFLSGYCYPSFSR